MTTRRTFLQRTAAAIAGLLACPKLLGRSKDHPGEKTRETGGKPTPVSSYMALTIVQITGVRKARGLYDCNMIEFDRDVPAIALNRAEFGPHPASMPVGHFAMGRQIGIGADGKRMIVVEWPGGPRLHHHAA